VQEVNTKRAQICLPPALFCCSNLQANREKTQEIKELTICDWRVDQNKTTSLDTRDTDSTLVEAKVKIMIVL